MYHRDFFASSTGQTKEDMRTKHPYVSSLYAETGQNRSFRGTSDLVNCCKEILAAVDHFVLDDHLPHR